VFEARVALQTLPTLLSEAVWGLAGDKNAVADSVAESIWFKADGDGVIVVENDDTSNTNDDIATGTTLTAGTFAIFRIDCTTITDCLFYINGARVASGTTFDMSQVRRSSCNLIFTSPRPAAPAWACSMWTTSASGRSAPNLRR
jgi:hypothetical protein